MPVSLEPIFRAAHLQLRPGKPVPEIQAEFFPFAGLTHTVRLREERLLVRVSDLFNDAPQAVIRVLALILLAKLYRRKVDGALHDVYRAFILGSEIQERARAARAARGRRPHVNSRGRWQDLEARFDHLNETYFGGSIGRPRLTWSARRSRRILGRYDATHGTISISRLFDSPQVPDFALDYVLYHEMLHIKHPSRVRNCRLVAHTSEFRREERRFQHYREASEWIRKI